MFAGVDASKSKVDVASSCETLKMQGVNPLRAAAELIRRKVRLVVVEASGGYERPVVEALQAKGVPVAIINPRQARDFAKALGRHAKTDSVDALVLAMFAEKFQPAPAKPVSPHMQRLRDIVTRRQQLVQLRTAEKNRLQQTTDAEVTASLLTIIQTLNKMVASITRSMIALIRQYAEWRRKLAILQAVDGIGAVTAAVLIADMEELGHVGRKQIAALAGVAPFDRQSGKWRGKSFCSGGRKSVRTVLYMATLTAVRRDGPLKAFYEKLVHAGKPRKLALNAAMRRFLVILNAIMRASMNPA